METRVTEHEWHAMTGGSLVDLINDAARQRRYKITCVESIQGKAGEALTVTIHHAAPLELRTR